RSSTRPLIQTGILTNRMFNYAVLACLTGQILVVHLPLLQGVFQTEPLSIRDWVALGIGSAFVLAVGEARKWW
ncbi:hypothetical protein BDK51DRAFT_6408, partial [Blyttiomyces helicus]